MSCRFYWPVFSCLSLAGFGCPPRVREFRAALAALINTIVNVSRKTESENERAARAEAESLRTACELCEIACEHGSAVPAAALEVRKAIAVLDAALVRFAVVAG